MEQKKKRKRIKRRPFPAYTTRESIVQRIARAAEQGNEKAQESISNLYRDWETDRKSVA